MGAYMRFPGGKSKALTLSYDDGVRQDKHLVEILDKYGIKATFNINSGCYSDKADFKELKGRMSEQEVYELFKDSPHEVAIHGYEHGYDEILPNNLMANEILQDRINIEKLTGKITRGMAYPYGTFNDKLVECLKVCGIAYSRTVISTENFSMPEDWLRLKPTCHHKNERIMELGDMFLKGNPRTAQMFYLWGHSYEFDENTPNSNWELIEEFAKKMGGHDDIWYATNIEIYDYTKAFEALEFSTDGKIVHNPTATDVWFVKLPWGERTPIKVEAGKTIRL